MSGSLSPSRKRRNSCGVIGLRRFARTEEYARTNRSKDAAASSRCLGTDDQL